MPAGWSHIYESKVTTAEEAVKAIKSGDRIFLTGNCSVPQVLLKALVQRAPELENVEICHALTIGASDYVAPEMEGHLRANALFIGPNVRKAVWEGRADFTPVLLSEFPLVFKKGILPVDVAFVHLSLPDEHGFCSYGIEAGLTKTAAESAKIIIAEVNPNMPRCLGDSFIHVSRIDYIVPVDYPLMELPMTTGGPSEIHVRIAEHIAELIPDGATMQMGIGEIPDAVLRFLRNKKDLGVHTELFSDGVIDLVEAGVITNARKTLHPGKIIAGFMLGTRRLYEWADDNPIIELRRTEYVNDPFVIAQNYRQVAINSAIEVDPDGAGLCRLHRPQTLQRGRRATGLYLRRVPVEEAFPSSRFPARRRSRTGPVVSRIVPMLKPERGRGDHPLSRPLRCDRIRRRLSLREIHPPAGSGPDPHRPPGLSGRTDPRSEGVELHLARGFVAAAEPPPRKGNSVFPKMWRPGMRLPKLSLTRQQARILIALGVADCLVLGMLVAAMVMTPRLAQRPSAVASPTPTETPTLLLPPTWTPTPTFTPAPTPTPRPQVTPTEGPTATPSRRSLLPPSRR